jgi:hypothetical protein
MSVRMATNAESELTIKCPYFIIRARCFCMMPPSAAENCSCRVLNPLYPVLAWSVSFAAASRVLGVVCHALPFFSKDGNPVAELPQSCHSSFFAGDARHSVHGHERRKVSRCPAGSSRFERNTTRLGGRALSRASWVSKHVYSEFEVFFFPFL